MSFKDLLVCLDAGSKSDVIAPYAASLAARMGAHLTSLALGIDPTAPISLFTQMPQELVDTAQQSEREARDAVAADLAGACALAGVMLEQHVLEGGRAQVEAGLARTARHFDLVIIEQAPYGDTTSREQLLEAVLFQSGRPVLVVPYIQQGPARLDKAILAWDCSLPAARAVAMTLPLLACCGHVEVTTVDGPAQSEADLPGIEITRHLARHDVAAALTKLTSAGDIASTLLSFAADSQADLLVMGGYGHSRLREIVLGGTTRDMLSAMTLPVVMVH